MYPIEVSLENEDNVHEFQNGPISQSTVWKLYADQDSIKSSEQDCAFI